jgi:serine/threonine protein kinase/Tol biopolymer transport system component
VTERVRRVLDLCEMAVARDATERRAFLERECADDEDLRREVEAVLESAAAARGFLTEPIDLGTRLFPGAPGEERLLDPPPHLRSGAVIGPYRIVREIGRGGMGAVFEAVQETLGRHVAVKLLPALFALDPTRLERFHREARAMAKLRHPSIVPVFEVGEAGGVHYYSMELVGGPSLGQVITRTREALQDELTATGAAINDIVYVANAVAQAAAIADGLEAAHRQGLVHRDVKPSNILVDPSGRWVLVDFGLVHDVEAQTITRSGDRMGTLAYMSPEQVLRREVEVDGRTDVYSLSATLYEVLTLEPPFRGASDHALANAIAVDEPPRPHELNSKVNRELETVLLRALEKERDKRYASAADFAADLRRVLDREPIVARPRSRASRLFGRARKHRVKIVAAFLVTLASLLAFVTWQAWPAKRWVLTDLRRLTSDPGLSTEPSLAMDGRFVAYTSDRSGEGQLDIWMDSLHEGESVRLTFHQADDREPSVSPDGQSIAFRSDREGGGIFLIPVEGGEKASIRLVGPKGRNPRFSPDGARIAYWVGEPSSDFGGEVFVTATTGSEQTLRLDVPLGRHPLWCPDGDCVIVVASDTESLTRGGPDWWILTPKTGTVRKTGFLDDLRSEGASRWLRVPPQAWITDAHELVFSLPRHGAPSLFAVTLSKTNDDVIGRPRWIAGTDAGVAASVDSRRNLAFARVDVSADLWSQPIDADTGELTGPLERLTHDLDIEMRPGISADGRLVAFQLVVSDKPDIWTLNVETRVRQRITSDGTALYGTRLNADGSKISFSRPGATVIGDLTTGIMRDYTPSGISYGLSADGSISIKYLDGSADHGLAALDVATGTQTPLVQHARYTLHQGQFSLDGRWLAFNAVADSRSRLFIAPYHPGTTTEEDEWIEVTGGADWADKPRWSPGGDLLYFLSDRDGYFCIYAQALNPQTKRPLGDGLKDVWHLHHHSPSVAIIGMGVADLAVARDKIVLNLGELTGNIWIGKLREDR